MDELKFGSSSRVLIALGISKWLLPSRDGNEAIRVASGSS
jgi:hypothetical protein